MKNQEKPEAKKSLLQLVQENIPDGKYKGLDNILEPHEVRKTIRK